MGNYKDFNLLCANGHKIVTKDKIALAFGEYENYGDKRYTEIRWFVVTDFIISWRDRMLGYRPTYYINDCNGREYYFTVDFYGEGARKFDVFIDINGESVLFGVGVICGVICCDGDFMFFDHYKYSDTINVESLVIDICPEIVSFSLDNMKEYVKEEDGHIRLIFATDCFEQYFRIDAIYGSLSYDITLLINDFICLRGEMSNKLYFADSQKLEML